jgi:uncharacterized protein
MFIDRISFEKAIADSIQHNPVTAILGPRQCGKTTLARKIAESFQTTFFDMEDPEDFELLRLNPKNILSQQKGLAVIDEIQRSPELFPILRVLSDGKNLENRFLILGSASPDLIKKSSESLAGRVGFINLSGFRIDEAGVQNINRLWQRGGFPRSFLASDETQSYQWRNDFIRTFLERDIPALGLNIPAATMRRFWIMLAHYHGQVWNGAEFARSLGISEPTVKRYLDILTGAYMIRQLPPWFENLQKRQVKAPKIYIRDSGILHALLSLEGNSIMNHVKAGASWEGFLIEELLHKLSVTEGYYWRTHTGAELDLMIFKNGKRLGFEIKFSEVPKITRSMALVRDDLKLDHLFLINNGKRKLELENGISLVPATEIYSTDFENF